MANIEINKDLVISGTGKTFEDLITDINGLKGEILWTNPNPTNSFGEQTITISNLSNYDWLEIYFYASTALTQQTVVKLKTNSANSIVRWWEAAKNANNERGIRLNSNAITFGSNSIYNVGIFNNVLIPHQIIGYKTGLFS